ncbi:P-loop containing nucleoside triphosphate hydrolase protein [Daedaleopsis nitida]|nr:P-loop containing nucleoside triphosphate hydrolase protein [Daedaleopsis nitida]
MSDVAPAVSPPSALTVSEVQQRVLARFGCRPCRWQCEVALALLRGDKDVICISGTGSGKTLPFWIPLVLRPNGIQLIITPLNILGSQNRQQLEKLGISAINIVAKTATSENIQKILDLQCRVVVVNPETALKLGGVFERVLKDRGFLERLISVVWDEAHLMTAWSSFRPELGQATTLCNLIPNSVPFLLPSATMPQHVLDATITSAGLRKERLVVLRRSNDRPNVYLTVRHIRYPLSSYKDLAFLIPDGWTPNTVVPRFIVFFDNIEQSVQAAEFVRLRLPAEHRNRILWFNADNTTEYREWVTAQYQAHNIIGLFCTDAFGMGIDIPDIELVVQWRLTCNLDSLWQRFGRAARGSGREAIAVLFVEPKYFDEKKEAAAQRAEKRKETMARKAMEREAGKRKRGEETGDPAEGRRRKRVRGGQGDGSLITAPPSPRTVSTHVNGDSDALVQDDQAAEPVPAELSEYEQLRVSYRVSQKDGGALKKGGRKGKSDGVELSKITPEIDHLINAGTRPFKCYRKPINAYYENDRIQANGQQCEDNCLRCTGTPPTICCSLCTPDHPIFAVLPPCDEPLPKTSTPRASQVDTSYKMNDIDIKLRSALHEFRRMQTLQTYGRAHLNNLGCGAIMGDDVLRRVLDCARANKIRSVDSLYRETKWNWSRELGNEVLIPT